MLTFTSPPFEGGRGDVNNQRVIKSNLINKPFLK